MKRFQSRYGNIIVVTMLCLILVMFLAAMVLDVGLIEVADTRLPTAADASVLVAVDDLGDPQAKRSTAQESTGKHSLDGQPIPTPDEKVGNGVWDDESETFDNTGDGNAVRIVLESLNRRTRMAGLFGMRNDSKRVDVIASTQPRDIVFVVDLSGSMNDDTENVWATKSIENQFEGTQFAGVGERLVQEFYTDMNFGNYPGQLEYIGEPLGGIPTNSDAYNQMTKNGGKLTESGIASKYRIQDSDSETTRKTKAYQWMIDKQIAVLMPEAKPTPNSDSNYAFWEKYLDYIMVVKYIGPPLKKKKKKRGGGGGPLPGIGQNQSSDLPQYALLFAQSQPLGMLSVTNNAANRGWIPPNVDGDRIYRFNNPNKAAYPNGDTNTRWSMRNKIGYRTYTQFMMDWGRDGKPEDNTYVQSSVNSPHCPYHNEDINGESYSFPPRTQPMHSVRRSLISAMQVIRDRNQEFGMTSQRDLISIMTFDAPSNGISITQTLTDDYDAAMDKCRGLQATMDKGSSTATEIGLKHAYEYLRPVDEGGVGRKGANKVVVLLTDGLPNAYISSNSDIDDFMDDNTDEEDFYGGGYYWLDAALMQGKIMQAEDWYIYPVGIGFGTDYDFMDRMARIGTTSIDGEAMRGTGNPAQYEESLATMFNEMITSAKVNLVK